MKNLLIIQQHQFGYLTDTLKWCDNLSEDYNVTVVCYDHGKAKLNSKGVKVIYVDLNKFRFLRVLSWFITIIYSVLINKGTIIVECFKGCGLLPFLFRRRKFILDVRTLSVSEDSNVRNSYNKVIFRQCQYYDYITVISIGVKEQFPDKYKNKMIILPLGADSISDVPKDYSKLSLLYVGTLYNRRLDVTIDALYNFIISHPSIDIEYHIVGDGLGNELDELNAKIQSYEIGNVVKLHGRVPYNELKPFFDKCSYGVSFIPITDYYAYQPPTKTFEYILSGLFTIGTSTPANCEIIKENNGILIKDTALDFVQAIDYIVRHNHKIDEKSVRLSGENYTWNRIVNEVLMPLL